MTHIIKEREEDGYITDGIYGGSLSSRAMVMAFHRAVLDGRCWDG